MCRSGVWSEIGNERRTMQTAQPRRDGCPLHMYVAPADLSAWGPGGSSVVSWDFSTWCEGCEVGLCVVGEELSMQTRAECFPPGWDWWPSPLSGSIYRSSRAFLMERGQGGACGQAELRALI